MFVANLLRWSCCLAPASLALPLVAQIPVALTMNGDSTVSVTSASGTSSATQPSGPAPSLVNRSAFVSGVGGAGFRWTVSTGFPHPAIETRILGSVHLNVAAPNVTAAKPQSDVLVTLSPGVAMPVLFKATRDLALYGTSQVPLWQVDLGNDGVFDYDNGMGVLPIVSRTIGPGPFQIRIRTSASLQQSGTMGFVFDIRVTPDSGVAVTPAMPGCVLPDVPVVPLFPNSGADVLWLGNPALLQPRVGVLGLGLAPLLLPTPLAVGPNCLLLPSPDVLFLVTPQASTLAIPVAARPLQLWTQCVSLEPSGLGTTNGYRLDAQ